MARIEKNTERDTHLEQLKSRLKTTWMAGDYDLFSRFMQKGAEEFFRRLSIRPGTRVLDVGCGAGQLALIAAKAGAHVTGCDIATNWLERARIRAAAEGLRVTFEEGDAEALPYADAQFEVVTSLLGAMFAPRPEIVAAELTRVCRPGGMIAMGNWTPGGFVGQMFKATGRYIAPSGMPSPVLWGDEAVVRNRMRDGIADLKFELRVYRLGYPFPPSAVVEFYRNYYGPMARAFASLDTSAQNELHAELVRLWSAHNKATDGTTRVDAEYLEVIATRAPAIHEVRKSAPLKDGKGRSHRAEALANRIEEGAACLATFAEGLSEEEWRRPISHSGNDRRSIGVIVHHVASLYPVEVVVARVIADGNALTDVTWDDLAALNAHHAQEHAEVTKDEALEQLRSNSREAADAVRVFTDDELDRAAPFSLSYSAPMTAQFVIEDHALRHSWHHLARIRAAVGR